MHHPSPCPGLASVANATVVVRFRIAGALRFLSHAETLRVLHRACARGNVPVKYTKGFNPHPKLSLPLPRTVGVASDDELLVIRLSSESGIPGASETSARREYETRMKAVLGEELPSGMEVLFVQLTESGASFRACSATYVFPFAREDTPELGERLKEKMEKVLASESVTMERKLPGKHKPRHIDVRDFLKSIQLKDGHLLVACHITAAGSLRVDEMMRLFDLKTQDLAGPVRRTNVRWDLT